MTIANFSPLVRRYLNRQQWLVARMNFIGASDTAAILGEGYANQSPVTIWNSKVNGEVDDEEQKRLRIGKLMEPSLRLIFSEETGLTCHDPGDWTIYGHPEIHWMSATLDGYVLDDDRLIPVELKNASYFEGKHWRGDEDEAAPLKFLIQINHQMAVTGAPYGYLSALIGGNEPVVRKIERNERFIAAMISKLTEFWGYVERRVLPPVDDSEATSNVLGNIFTEDKGLSVVLPPEAREWAVDLESAKADKKDAKARETAAANKLEAAIGIASIGDIPGYGRYSWATQHRKAYPVEATSFRVLRRLSK